MGALLLLLLVACSLLCAGHHQLEVREGEKSLSTCKLKLNLFQYQPLTFSASCTETRWRTTTYSDGAVKTLPMIVEWVEVIEFGVTTTVAGGPTYTHTVVVPGNQTVSKSGWHDWTPAPSSGSGEPISAAPTNQENSQAPSLVVVQSTAT